MPVPPPPSPPPASRRLVVTLPGAAGGDSPPPTRYRPASEHFRAREASSAAYTASPPPRGTMAAGGRRSPSPENGSDETPSAPSEFLAEFLSAIMRRQYAEALKYCRLILQYEPNNATARGFYPLLQHKLQNEQPEEGATASSSDERSASSARAPLPLESCAADSEDEAGSVGSQSSLELDSEPSLELSRRTDSGGASGGWESSYSASRSDADDNGNPAPAAPAARDRASLAAGDVENDNATAGGGEPHTADCLKNESLASLRRLRAQFACSIK